MATQKQQIPSTRGRNVEETGALLMLLFSESFALAEPGKFTSTYVTRSEDGVTALYGIDKHFTTIRAKIFVDPNETADFAINNFKFQIGIRYGFDKNPPWSLQPYVDVYSGSSNVKELTSKIDASIDLARKFDNKESLEAFLKLRK